ncbi:TPA: hypothetical protein ACGD5E_000978 [Serratia marcescens]|jgi:hypothetical protein
MPDDEAATVGMWAVSGNKKPDNLEPKRRDYRAPQNGDIKEKQWH